MQRPSPATAALLRATLPDILSLSQAKGKNGGWPFAVAIPAPPGTRRASAAAR